MDSRRNGRCSFAISWRTRPIDSRCAKAPKDCNWWNAQRRVGKNAAGSISRPCQYEKKAMNRVDNNPKALSIDLPRADRRVEKFHLSEPRNFPERTQRKLNRIAFAATHVVADPQADNDPWLDCAIDWDKTIAYREYLWGLGLGVAEAMDTAQRGMGVDWPTSLELITRAVNASKAWSAREGRPALIAAGCGTDQLDLSQVRVGQAHSIDE